MRQDSAQSANESQTIARTPEAAATTTAATTTSTITTRTTTTTMTRITAMHTGSHDSMLPGFFDSIQSFLKGGSATISKNQKSIQKLFF